MDKKLLLLLALNVLLIIILLLSRKRKKLNNFFIFVFTTFLMLTIIEVVYRFFLKKNPIRTVSNYTLGVTDPNPMTGFSMSITGDWKVTLIADGKDTVYSTSYLLIPDSGHHKINFNHRVGYRPARFPDTSEIVFLGCSITFGEGLKDNENFVYRTGENCQIPSSNYGLSGFGTHQAYQLYMNKFKEKADTLERIFVYNYVHDHIMRAKCVYPWNNNDPYFKVQNDSLVLAGPASANTSYARTQKITKYATLLGSFSFISDLVNNITMGKARQNIIEEDYKRVALMMQQIQKQVALNNDRFIVLYWDKYNWKGQDDEKIVSRKRIEDDLKALEASGAKVIKASEIFDVNDPKYFIPKDGHPTAETDALIANFLAKIICQ